MIKQRKRSGKVVEIRREEDKGFQKNRMIKIFRQNAKDS